MPHLKLITFDLDNTLWPVAQVIERAELASSRFLQARFPDFADALTVPALHDIRNRLAVNQSHYWKNLTRLRTDMLTAALTAQGISLPEAQRTANDAFDVFYEARNQVVFFPDAEATLQALGKHYLLGALSNGNANLDLIGIRHLFAFHHSAESVGDAKPSAAMFHAALTSAGVSAAEALHVGDHPDEDIEGARRAGFATVWANLLEQDWPAHLAPTRQIHQLNELNDLLKAMDD